MITHRVRGGNFGVGDDRQQPYQIEPGDYFTYHEGDEGPYWDRRARYDFEESYYEKRDAYPIPGSHEIRE